MKSALTIAGSDSSGGAGIQADIKAMSALGVFAQSAITALTAQNTTGVYGVHAVPPEFIVQQIQVVFDDIRPDAVKIGMISEPEQVKAIAEALKKVQAENIVLDPVMVATSGSELSSNEAVEANVAYLMPLACVVTPNIAEAEVLSGMKIDSREDMVAAGKAICEAGAQAVLVKGGHLGDTADDLLYYSDGTAKWFSAPRVETANTHGTGCTLSSAIAAHLALGYELSEAVEKAKAYLTGALRHDPHLGKGSGPLNHFWASSQE